MKILQTFEPLFWTEKKKHQNLFVFLWKFQNLSKNTIKTCATDLEMANDKLAQENEQDKIVQIAEKVLCGARI